PKRERYQADRSHNPTVPRLPLQIDELPVNCELRQGVRAARFRYLRRRAGVIATGATDGGGGRLVLPSSRAAIISSFIFLNFGAPGATPLASTSASVIS